MKLWNYMFTITGLSVILALAGLDIPILRDLFNAIGLTVSNSGIETFAVESTLWSKIFGTGGILTAIGTTGAIGIGGFLYTKDKSFLIVPLITGVLFIWASVLVAIVLQKGGYEVFGTIISIIWIALTIGFIQSCIDYFMGVN